MEHTDPTVAESTGPGPVRAVFRWWLRVIGLRGPLARPVAATGAVRRRRGLIGVGAGLALGAVVVRGLVAVGRSRTLDGIPPDSDPAGAAAVYDALTRFLTTTAWAVLALGLVLALGGWLTGRPWRRARRDSAAPRPGPASAGSPGRS